MDNPGLNISHEDIDSRLARFEEDGDDNNQCHFYEEASGNSNNYSPSHENLKCNNLMYDLPGRLREHKEQRHVYSSCNKVSAHAFSEGTSSRLTNRSHNDCIASKKQYAYSSPNKMTFEAASEDYFFRHPPEKLEKQCAESSFIEKSADKFSDEYSRGQSCSFVKQDELYAGSSLSSSRMPPENSSHYLALHLKRKILETKESSKHASYKDSFHESVINVCDLKESSGTGSKLSVDSKSYEKRDEMMGYKRSRLKVESSDKKERWSHQCDNTNKSKFSVDIDYEGQHCNEHLLRGKSNRIYKQSEVYKYGPNDSGLITKQETFSGFDTKKDDDAHYVWKISRRENILKNSDLNNHTDESSCSYFGTEYDEQKNNVSGVRKKSGRKVQQSKILYNTPDSFHSDYSKFKNYEGINADVDSDFKMNKKKCAVIDYNEKSSKLNILSYGDSGVKSKCHLQRDAEHKMPEISSRNLYDKYLKSESEIALSEIDLQEKYERNKHFKNKENMSNVWRRQNVHNDERFVEPINDLKNRNEKRRSTVNTFTMHDARKIAPLVLRHPIQDNHDEDRAEDFQIINNDSWFENKRKCWTRICWSKTKHSHAVAYSGGLHAPKDRNAIVNSIRSPQYATKAKKRTFSDCWSSFLKVLSSRFQVWNRTLKKIEGQFGTGVVSYFVFLRWLILLNFVIFLLYFLIIVLPYSAFSLLPHRNTKLAPNETLLTDEYLQQFPKKRDVPLSSKRTRLKNVSLDLDEDLLSNLGTLLESYVPNEILDLTVRYDKKNHTGEERYQNSLYCKDRYEREMANYTNGTFSFLQDFLQGTGWLQSTILFLGFYPDSDVSYFGLPYNLPVSFVAVLLVSFFLSLVLMLQYSSHGIQENILTRKSTYLTFSNILFCSWDYCIEDKKTAAIRHKSINGEIKSNLAEERRKLEVSQWSSEKRVKVYLLRITINILVIAALFGCFYLIYRVVNLQLEKQRQNALKDAGVYTLFIQFLPPLVITGLNIMMPIIFYSVAKFEMYNTQTQVNVALFRIVFLRLASVFVLVSSLYQQITCEPKDNCKAGMSDFCRTPICWETYVGQQLYKLVITDFLVYIFMFLGYDLPRDFIVQKCKCKVTEVVGRQVFDLPSQVLSLVYSQTLCWLGLFYSPLLPGISLLKFIIIFYIKKVVVLKHCIPAPVLYKASRSNTIFMTILMISLFFVTVIHGYSLTSIEPSPGCSPFRQYVVMINAIADAISDWSPTLVTFMTVLFSGFFFIPAFLLLCLIIYYYWTVVVAHRKMIKVLKAQIVIEGRDKQFLLNRLAEAARQATTN